MPKQYIAPTLTVDSVVFQIIDNQLAVLVIRRANEPFKGDLALPGGYCAEGETTLTATQRILSTKAGLSFEQVKYCEQLYTFDSVAADPRGQAVDVCYLGLGKDFKLSTSQSTESPAFHFVNDLPKLAYDHSHIVQYAHDRLKSKLTYTSAIFALLDTKFTLSELQSAYEAVLEQKLDKRNFRKKFLSLDMVHETNEMKKDGAHRPARLFEFNKPEIQILTRSFD